MLKEFREFIARGNVIDLAVAVVIGAAFGRIITALVDGIIMRSGSCWARSTLPICSSIYQDSNLLRWRKQGEGASSSCLWGIYQRSRKLSNYCLRNLSGYPSDQ